MLFRLILLLVIAGTLVIFTWSNLQPIALTFLGIQTPAFPLALWVLGAIAAGILTNVTINILVGLSNYATGRALRYRFKQSPRSRFEQLRRDRFGTSTPNPEAARSYQSTTSGGESDATWKNWEGYEEPVTTRQSVVTEKQPATDSLDDDWDLETSDDWEAPQTTPVDRHSADPTFNKRTSYEAPQEPKSVSRSGSVYSYGYRDPGETGVGRQEKVVDAEYRVIIPPYNPPPPPPYTPSAPEKPEPESEDEENADDWFEEDGNDSGGADWRRSR
jgi:uncharacterized integral membrane protein